jgi:hypothetical protein
MSAAVPLLDGIFVDTWRNRFCDAQASTLQLGPENDAAKLSINAIFVNHFRPFEGF